MQNLYRAALTPARAIHRAIRHRVLDRVIRRASKRSPLRLVLGSGSLSQKGWLATDREHLDMLNHAHWSRYFGKESVDAMFAEHVWEHLTEADAVEAARNCRCYLKPGGYLRVAVPDGLHPSQAYRDAVKPMGSGAGADDHKVLYTYATLSRVFEEAGFRVELLEYFDENGSFQAGDWDPKDGLVLRSRRFDERNSDGRLNYTSIILDARK
jgi:predicted SAM-dependent methyltransferase